MFTTSGSVGSSLSPTNATFAISPSILVTSTENTTFAVEFSATSTKIPEINSSAVYVLSPTVTFPFIFAFCNMFAKSLSFTIILPGTLPVFSTDIVYVMISPTFATSTGVSFLVITLVLSVLIIDVSVLLLSSPLAIATFSIVPVAPSLTITVKFTVVVAFASISTNHLKDVTTVPLSNSSAFGVLDTYVVLAGISSVT